MNNDRVISKYCCKVKKRLVGFRKTKTKLINGLKEELENCKLSENVSLTTLEANIGNVVEMAEQLQATIPDKEYYSSKRNKIIVCSVIIAIAVLAVIAGILQYTKHIREDETGYINTIIVIEDKNDYLVEELNDGVIWE